MTDGKIVRASLAQTDVITIYPTPAHTHAHTHAHMHVRTHIHALYMHTSVYVHCKCMHTHIDTHVGMHRLHKSSFTLLTSVCVCVCVTVKVGLTTVAPSMCAWPNHYCGRKGGGGG